MNELLISEIKSDEKGLLTTFELIEEFIFSSESVSAQALTDFVLLCQKSIVDTEDPLDKVEQLINTLFIEQLLIDNHQLTWPSISYQMSTGLNYRLLAPTLKAVVLRHIFEACDFDADIVFIPEKVMVRVSCDEIYAIIFDPITGESMDAYQLDSCLEDVDGDPSQLELASMTNSTLVVEHMTSLKNALIQESKFDQALKCVDIFLALRPGNPFERRDRGFLLHQLDCFKVAYDDYQYFVEQCPKEPEAQLLKLQLDKITITDTVLH